MSYELSAEQIGKNWEDFMGRLDYFPTRKEKLQAMYADMEDRMVLMPASSVNHHHNAIPGGYVDHVLRVMDCSLLVLKAWSHMGAKVDNFTQEELMFAAMHHDLGKYGMPEANGESYLPNDSDWHVKNQGKIYKINGDINFMLIQDRSLFLLQHYGIQMSTNEYIGIRVHDGMYDEANKSYYMSFNPDSKMKNWLPLILHHADHMAACIEYDKWKSTQSNPNAGQQYKTKKKTIPSSSELSDSIKNNL